MPGTRPAVDTVIRRGEKPAPQGCSQQRERARDVVEVVQRLAHPHEHQVGRPAARQRGGPVDLRDDLAGAAGGARSRASRSRRSCSRSRSRPATRCTGSACCGPRPRRGSAPIRWRGRRACGSASLRVPSRAVCSERLRQRHQRVVVLQRRAQRRRDVGHRLERLRRPGRAASGRSARRGRPGAPAPRPSSSARRAAARADRGAAGGAGVKRGQGGGGHGGGRIHHVTSAA